MKSVLVLSVANGWLLEYEMVFTGKASAVNVWMNSGFPFHFKIIIVISLE